MKAKLTARTITALRTDNQHYKVWDTELKGLFLRVSPKGTKTYCLFYRHEGRANEFTLGRHGALTPITARQFAAEKLGEVARGTDIQVAKKDAANVRRRERASILGTFVDEEFGPWVLGHNRRGDEILRVMNREFGDLLNLPMKSVSPRHIHGWMTEARKRNLKPNTINRHLSAIKRVLNVAVEWGLLEYNPIAKVKKLKVDELHRVRFLVEHEEVALREALDQREGELIEQRERYNEWLRARHVAPFPSLRDRTFVDHLKPMVLLAMNTGLRRGEIFSLQAKDVDLARGILTVRPEVAKNARARHVGINNEARCVFTGWGLPNNPEALVFPSPTTNQRFDNIAKSWNGVVEISGLSDFRFHDLRHHFASKLVMTGVDLLTIKELLGHSSLDMTLRYAHLAPDHKLRAVDALDSSASNEVRRIKSAR